MRNGTFVMDAHTGVWDGSAANCKNRFGDEFIETFYAFHNGFNPPGGKWTMEYETVFRKTDPQWYLEEMFVKGEAVGSNSSQALASRREGDRSTVEFGGDERHDIPDALLTGG